MEPGASLPVLLRDLERALGHKADSGNARRILLLQLAGFSPGEIRDQLNLSVAEFIDASRALRVAAATVVEC